MQQERSCKMRHLTSIKMIKLTTQACSFLGVCLSVLLIMCSLGKWGTAFADSDESGGRIELRHYGTASISYDESDGNNIHPGDNLYVKIFNYGYTPRKENVGDMTYIQSNTDGSTCSAQWLISDLSQESFKIPGNCNGSGKSYSKKATLKIHIPPTGDVHLLEPENDGWITTRVGDVEHRWFVNIWAEKPSCKIEITPTVVDLGKIYSSELQNYTAGDKIKTLQGSSTIETTCNDSDYSLSFKSNNTSNGCINGTDNILQFCLTAGSSPIDMFNGRGEIILHGDGSSSVDTPLTVTTKRGTGSPMAGNISAIVTVTASPQ